MTDNDTIKRELQKILKTQEFVLNKSLDTLRKMQGGGTFTNGEIEGQVEAIRAIFHGMAETRFGIAIIEAIEDDYRDLIRGVEDYLKDAS